MNRLSSRCAPTLLAFGLLAAALSAQAQAWPQKRINFIVPSAPGGSTDIIARLLSDPLAQELKQPVVVENRAGASGNIGTEVALRAPADGYTVLIQYSGYHVGNPALYPNLKWNPRKDFAGVAMLMRSPHVIAINGGLPARSVKQLIEHGRGKNMFYASSGQGSIQHIAGVLFAKATGLHLTHVPYKGAGPAINDMLNGQVDLFITTPPSLIGHVSSGKIRLLAYTGTKRHPALAEVPTTAEAGMPSYLVDSWFAAFVPAATPKPVIDQLSAAMRKVVESAAFRKRVEEQGAVASYMNPAALNAFVQSELDAWAKTIREANIKAE